MIDFVHRRARAEIGCFALLDFRVFKEQAPQLFRLAVFDLRQLRRDESQ